MFDSKDREERTSTFHVRYEIGPPPLPPQPLIRTWAVFSPF